MPCAFLRNPEVRNQPFGSCVGVVGIQVKNRKDSRHARWWIAANAWQGGFFASTSRPETCIDSSVTGQTDSQNAG